MVRKEITVIIKEMVETVTDNRAIFILCTFLLLISTSLFSQVNLVFAEIETGSSSITETDEEVEKFIFLRSNLYYDRPDLTFLWGSKFDQFIDNYNTSNLSTVVSLEKRMNTFSNNTYFQYREYTTEAYKIIDLNNSMLWNREFRSGADNLSLSLNWQHSLDDLDYDEISGTLYYLWKRYYAYLSLHQQIDFTLMTIRSQEISSELLCNLKYEMNLSKPLMENLGLSLNLSLNHNINTEDRVLIPNENFYNSVSLNSQTISLSLTYMMSEFLFKPRFSFTNRKYLSLAVEDEFNDTEINAGVYIDWITSSNLLFYGDFDHSTISDEAGNNNILTFTGGIKYQFDIYVK